MNGSLGKDLLPANVRHTTAMRGRALRWLSITIGWGVLIAGVVWSVGAGVEVRKWAWDATRTIRFTFDIGNGYNQGARVFESMTRIAARENRKANWGDFFSAYLGNYSDVVDHSINGNYGLDYTPARLLVMSLWVKHLRESDPPINEWNSGYETTEPLLRFNTACEALSAIALFALVRHWRRARAGWAIIPHWRHPWREWPAVLAGLAVWFNPALIWNAHVWPQWDCWLLPFFLFGLLAASKDKWLLAGFVLLIGASFKGQVLMVLPVVLLWPILMGRPMAAVRFLIGGLAFAALMALPWMIYTNTARAWLIVVLITAIASAIVLGRRRKFDRVGIIVAVVVAITILPLMIRPEYWVLYLASPLLMFMTAVLPRWVPSRWLPPLILAELAMAIFFAGAAFGGHFDWFEIGYLYPQHHYPLLTMSGANLGTILMSYGWNIKDTVSLSWLTDMTIRSFLIMLFCITLVPCGIGAAIRANRRSPAILISIAVPWVMMFAFMPQMHERYLLWGAVVMCAGVGISIGDGLLAAAVTFFAWANMAAATLPNNPRLAPGLTAMVRGMMSGSAWGVVFLALVCLYAAVAGRRRAQHGIECKSERELSEIDPLM